MKKAISAIIILISLLLCLGACADTMTPEGMQLASGENEAFYLYVPDGWINNTSGGTASAYYTSSDRSNVNMTCMLQEAGLTTLEEYGAKCRTSLAAILPEYADIGDITAVKLGTKDAISFEYSAKLDGINYKYRQVATMVNDMFYVLTYTSTAEKYDSHAEALEQIIANVIFK